MKKNLRVSILSIGSVSLGLLVHFGCAQKQIHSGLKADPGVLLRSWVWPTREASWIGDHGTENSNVLLEDGVLYLGSRSQGVTALHSGMKQVKWTFSLTHGVVSEMTAEDGVLYFVAGDGFCYAVSQASGESLWKVLLKTPFASKPTVDRGRVYVNTASDLLVVLDARTGKELWTYRRHAGEVLPKIYGASQPWVGGEEVWVGWSDGYVSVLDRQEGLLKWEQKIHPGGRFLDVNAHPIVDQEAVYLPSYDGFLYAWRRTDKEVLWRLSAGGAKEILIDQDRLYLSSSDGQVYAVEKNSGKVLWKFPLDRGVPSRVIVLPEGILVGSSQQFLYLIDRADGRPLFRYDVGSSSGWTASPLFDPTQRAFYFLSQGGGLYRFVLPKRLPPKKAGRTLPHQWLL